MILSQSFFSNHTVEVAQSLLWKLLVFIDKDWNKFSWIINEVEAYRWQDDEASHAYIWITTRNKIMYDTFWFVYVYFIYWNYYCLNFTTEDIWIPWAVLIRSLIPFDWTNIMSFNRYDKNFIDLDKNKLKNLTNWPWKLCQAFWIAKAQNWLLLSEKNNIYLEDIWYKIPSYINSWSRIWITKWIQKNRRFWF